MARAQAEAVESFKTHLTGGVMEFAGNLAALLGGDELAQTAGSIISGAMKGAKMGAAAGGPAGAAAGAAAGIGLGVGNAAIRMVREHEEFADLMAGISDAMESLGMPDVVGNLIKSVQFVVVPLKQVGMAFKPIIDVFGGLGDNSRLMFKASKQLSMSILNVSERILNVADFIVNTGELIITGIKNLLDAIPKALRPKKLSERVNKMAEGFGDTADVIDRTQESIDKSQKKIGELTYEDAANSVKRFGEEVDEAARKVKNLPDVFKLTLREMQAIDAGGNGGGGGGGGGASGVQRAVVFGEQTGQGRNRGQDTYTPIYFGDDGGL
jgi:methyl-accepting chemotaxis protein